MPAQPAFSNFIERQHLEQLVMQRYTIGKPGSAQQRATELAAIDAQFVELVKTAFVRSNAFPKAELMTHSVATVVDYLERTHVLYLQKRLPEIAQTIHILHKNYEVPRASLVALDVFIKRYSAQLAAHIEEEERELFPYVHELVRANRHRVVTPYVTQQLAANKLQRFLDTHSDTENDLQRAQQAIRAYEPSRTNQSPYRILLDQLAAFELDLHIHSRMEEEVLVPKALALETAIRQWSRA